MVKRFIAAAALTAALLLPAPARAQNTPPDGWKFRSELTSVMSMGNAEAFTFGVGAALEHRQGKNLFKLETGGIHTESTIKTREARGTPLSYVIVEEENREKTAEAYFARTRYDRALSERVFVFGGADWHRNTFAGIKSRTVLSLGAGNIWRDSETVRFRTNYAATFTVQADVVDRPGVAGSFAGARIGWEYWRKLTSSTEFESRLIGDLNLDETDDLRADFTNALTVSINSALALKPSLQVLWRNQPSLTSVPLVSPQGIPLNQAVLTPLEKTDMLFRLALVLTL